MTYYSNREIKGETDGHLTIFQRHGDIKRRKEDGRLVTHNMLNKP